MKETDIKYLAGLLDADGSFFFNYPRGFAYLTISLDLSDSIDRNFEYTYWLSEQLGVKPCIGNRDPSKWANQAKITICKRSTLEMLVPRLLKYLVIKGKHLARLYDKWRELRGVKSSKEHLEKLKEFVKSSRADVGPIRAKSWLPKAYVAGYLDGDGSYCFKKSSGKYGITTVSHADDRIVQDLLLKQYGGTIRIDKAGHVRWYRTLGKTQRSFAIPFLKDMVRHSRLKKWKIEQFLHYHSQRLTKITPTGEVIV